MATGHSQWVLEVSAPTVRCTACSTTCCLQICLATCPPNCPKLTAQECRHASQWQMWLHAAVSGKQPARFTHPPTFHVPQSWCVTVASPASLCGFDGHSPAAEDLSGSALPGCTCSVPSPTGMLLQRAPQPIPNASTVLRTALLMCSALHAEMTFFEPAPTS